MSVEAANRLLPTKHEQFRDKDYWDQFFLHRQEKAFEWYGNYNDFEHLVAASCRPSDRILVVGCGNSDMSADFYDNGYQHVTNIDFSERVIAEMTKKNSRRKNMKWLVMDMLNLSFKDQEFDVVVDKGALDALFASEDPATAADVGKMFSEIARVLATGGRYICISMAQDYIAKKFLQDFHISWCWSVSLDEFKTNKYTTDSPESSPLQPYFLVAQKPVQGSSVGPLLFFNQSPMVLLSSHWAQAAVQGLNSEACVDQVLRQIQDTQRFNFSQHSLRKVKVGGIHSFELHGSEASGIAANNPRYLVTVIDHTLRGQNGPCGVFIIPQGREHEWLFSSSEGQKTLAESALFNRLIIIALGRGHTFGSMDEVQAELSPKMLELIPEQDKASTTSGSSIPFLTVPQGLGKRVIVAEGHSQLSGDYVVEDVIDTEEQESAKTVLRRLVFLQNRNLIQTEARMNVTSLSGAKNKKKKKKNQKKAGTLTENEATSESAAAENGVEAVSKPKATLDLSYVSEYHKAMIAGILASSKQPSNATVSQKAAVIVGLGGGILPMYMKKMCKDVQIKVVEIDSAVADIARDWFGFVQDNRLSVEIADGLEYVQKPRTAQSLQYLILDVDSKDTTSAMSCPPEAFVSEQYLKACRDALSVDGVFVLNIVSRSDEIYTNVLERINSIFEGGEVFELRPSDEEVNRVVFAFKSRAFKGKAPRLNVDVDMLDDPAMMELSMLTEKLALTSKARKGEKSSGFQQVTKGSKKKKKG